MPGSAIGRMISSETALRPKNLVRCRAIAAIVPSTSAIAVASSPTSTLTSSACRAPDECAAASHQRTVSPLGGQANDVLTLNELSTTRASGK